MSSSKPRARKSPSGDSTDGAAAPAAASSTASSKKKTSKRARGNAPDAAGDEKGASASAAAAASAKPYSHAQYQLMKLQPSEIANKMKRKQMWLKVKAAKEEAKSQERKKRRKDVENGVAVSNDREHRRTTGETETKGWRRVRGFPGRRPLSALHAHSRVAISPRLRR